MKRLAYKNIVPELLKLIPEFVHFQDFKDVQDRVHIPYVVFGAFWRFYLSCYQRGDYKILKIMADFLEEMTKSKDIGVKELLLIHGFLDHIDTRADYYAGIVESFEEHTKQLLLDVKGSREEFENIVHELLKCIPELAQSEDFKRDKGNQDNQYVVFGIFRNFYLESFQQGKKELVKRMSDFLEKMAKKTKSIFIQELLANGFLENLDKKADYYEGTVKTFGEHTRKQLRDVDKFWSNYEETKCREIYELWKKGLSISSLQEKFGVKKKVIHTILEQAKNGDFEISKNNSSPK